MGGRLLVHTAEAEAESVVAPDAVAVALGREPMACVRDGRNREVGAHRAILPTGARTLTRPRPRPPRHRPALDTPVAISYIHRYEWATGGPTLEAVIAGPVPAWVRGLLDLEQIEEFVHRHDLEASQCGLPLEGEEILVTGDEVVRAATECRRKHVPVLRIADGQTGREFREGRDDLAEALQPALEATDLCLRNVVPVPDGRTAQDSGDLCEQAR